MQELVISGSTTAVVAEVAEVAVLEVEPVDRVDSAGHVGGCVGNHAGDVAHVRAATDINWLGFWLRGVGTH